MLLCFLINFLLWSNPNSQEEEISQVQISYIKYIKITITILIGVFPESFFIVLSIRASLGLRRIITQNVYVKNVQKIETLGSTDVILCDKTGALTTGELIVKKFLLNVGE